MTDQPGSTARTWAPFVRYLGAAIAILGAVGTIAVYSDLNQSRFDDVDASTAEVWLAVLTGLAATGIGAVVFALGLLLDRD